MCSGSFLVEQELASQNGLGVILQILWLIFFVLYALYGQKFQVRLMLGEIEAALHKLKSMRDKGRYIVKSAVRDLNRKNIDPTERVDRILEHVFIEPVDLDPYGVIKRLEHLMDVRDFRLKEEVKLMAPDADDTQINNLINALEAATALNQIFKVVRHYYSVGRKTLSFYVILQLQMILPEIMKKSEAYASALTAFTNGQPIGDGIGSLVAAMLMHKAEKREIASDTLVGEVMIDGRKVYVIKAKGPGGNVGKPGEAVRRLLEEKAGKISQIIIVDAALKLEGEKAGEVVEGSGVAIGGADVEKYKVEEVAAKYKVPVTVILVKESIKDALSAMRKEIFESTEEVINRIKRVIHETSEGDQIIVVGVGNTVGIAQ